MSSETLSYFFKNEDIKLNQDIQRDHNGTENV